MKNKFIKGVTLIEFMVVLAIVFIIFALIINVVQKNENIRMIDGCQYIQSYNGHGWSLTHKGNCTNQIHFQKQ